MTAWVVLLHARCRACAGPLWRDEISSVAVANSPTLGELYRHLPLDSNLLFGHAVLRAWMRLGPGASDGSLRSLGLLVGLGTVAALWWNGRLFGARSPVLSLALLGLGGTAICYADSIRPYGLGMLFGLLSMGALFCAAGRSDRRSLGVALALSVAAVHTLFFNTVWLLAAGAGAAAVCAAHRRLGRMVAVLGIGAACAASMAVYLPMIRGRAVFASIFVVPTTVQQVLSVLRDALALTPLGAPVPGDWLWGIALALGIGVACLPRRAVQAPSPAADRQADARTFCLVALVVGVPTYVGFLVALSNQAQQFHFVPLLALVASGVDGACARLTRTVARLAVVLACAAVTAALAPEAWRTAGMRMSDVDRVADHLARLARPGDLVVVTPWWLGSPLVRYYRGPADVMSAPPLADLRYQRYDLLLGAMANPAAGDPLLARVAAVRQAGRQVWLVRFTGYPVTYDPHVPIRWPGARAAQVAHYAYWNQRLAQALRAAYGQTPAVDVPVDDGVDVNPFERVQLLGFGG